MASVDTTDKAEPLKESSVIKKPLSTCPTNIPEVRKVQEQRVWVTTAGFWEHLDLARLNNLQTTFAPLMRYRTAAPKNTVEINLPDAISQRSWNH